MKFYKASQWILVATSCIYLLFCVVNLIISNEFVISLILALILVLNTGYTIVFFPKKHLLKQKKKATKSLSFQNLSLLKFVLSLSLDKNLFPQMF